MKHRILTLKFLAAAAVAALPLLAQAGTSRGEITPDGWLEVNGRIVRYVGPPAGTVGKSRAEVQAELAAHRASAVGHDGWAITAGDHLVFVGAPAGTVGKTRAQVQAELAEYRRNPVTHDGWRQHNGELLEYVGVSVPMTTAGTAAMDATRAVR